MCYVGDKFDILFYLLVKVVNFFYVVWICLLLFDSIKMRFFFLLGENLVSKVYLCIMLILGKVRLLSIVISVKCDYILLIEVERV